MGLNTTIARIGIAPMNISSGGAITYDNIIWLESTEAGGREINAKPKGELTEIFADGLAVIANSKKAGYDIDLTLLAIIDDIEEELYGNTKNGDGWIVETGGDREAPPFALLAAKETYKGTTLYDIDVYYSCTAGSAERHDKTSENDFNPEFPTIPIYSRPRLTDKLVRCTIPTDTLPTTVPEPAAVPQAPASH